MIKILPGRVLGVDLGAKRIGLALSDPTRTVASPHSVLLRGRSHEVDHQAIVATAREADATAIVVGLPLSLSGREGPAAGAAREFATALAARLDGGVPVVFSDERLTTVVATRQMRESGRKGRRQRAVVDQVAAVAILQGWLDARR